MSQATVAEAEPKKRNRLLQKRQTTADDFNTSVDTIKRLEREGRLTPVRLFKNPKADVYHDPAEVAALKDALFTEAAAERRRPLKKKRGGRS